MTKVFIPVLIWKILQVLEIWMITGSAIILTVILCQIQNHNSQLIAFF